MNAKELHRWSIVQELNDPTQAPSMAALRRKIAPNLRDDSRVIPPQYARELQKLPPGYGQELLSPLTRNSFGELQIAAQQANARPSGIWANWF